MITTLKSVKGKVVKGDIDDIHRRDVSWIDCFAPTLNELRIIAEKTGLPLSELKEYVDPQERPKVIDLEKFSVIVFGAPIQKQHSVKITPIAIFISKNSIITFRQERIFGIDKIKGLAEAHKIKLFGNPTIFLRYLLDNIISDYFKIFDKIEDKIEKVEDTIIKHPDKIKTNDIFKIKKTLIYFHKSLVANREVVTGIEKEYLSKVHKKEIYKFRELYNDIVQLIDMEETHREIMTGVLDMYLGTLSNNMNEVVRKLTVYASYILVPTLISGIYGMNFKYMPEIFWTYGYVFALGLMFFSVLGMHFFFRKKGWV